MNSDRMQVFDLLHLVKQIRRGRKEDDFFREFDAFVLAILRIVMLFFGVRTGEETAEAKPRKRLFADEVIDLQEDASTSDFYAPFSRYSLCRSK